MLHARTAISLVHARVEPKSSLGRKRFKVGITTFNVIPVHQIIIICYYILLKGGLYGRLDGSLSEGALLFVAMYAFLCQVGLSKITGDTKEALLFMETINCVKSDA